MGGEFRPCGGGGPGGAAGAKVVEKHTAENDTGILRGTLTKSFLVFEVCTVRA